MPRRRDPSIDIIKNARQQIEALPPLPPDNDAMLAIRHPRLPPRETTHELIQDRINRYAEIMDDAVAGLQQAAIQAQRENDLVALAAINERLARISSGVILSPVAAAIRPGEQDVDLDQFSAATRKKLVEAFAAAHAELKEKGAQG